MAGTLRSISVILITELFHTYPTATPVATKTFFVPFSSTTIVTDLQAFMISACQNIEINIQLLAHRREYIFEEITII